MFACIAIFVHSILSHYSIAPRCRNRLATPEGYADCMVLHFLVVSRSSNLQVKESSYEKCLLFKRHFSLYNPSGMLRTTWQNELQCHGSACLFKCRGLSAKIIQQRHCIWECNKSSLVRVRRNETHIRVFLNKNSKCLYTFTALFGKSVIQIVRKLLAFCRTWIS